MYEDLENWTKEDAIRYADQIELGNLFNKVFEQASKISKDDDLIVSCLYYSLYPDDKIDLFLKYCLQNGHLKD